MEYSDAMHRLVSGTDGRVYLDTSPRVCIKGAEERDGLGYGLLADEDVFPFFELRSAAVDMRGASQKSYDDAELRKRVAAQLDTCREAGVRHVVLSLRLRRVPKSEPDRRRGLQARSAQAEGALRRRRLRHLPRGLRPGQLRGLQRYH